MSIQSYFKSFGSRRIAVGNMSANAEAIALAKKEKAIMDKVWQEAQSVLYISSYIYMNNQNSILLYFKLCVVGSCAYCSHPTDTEKTSLPFSLLICLTPAYRSNDEHFLVNSAFQFYIFMYLIPSYNVS